MLIAQSAAAAPPSLPWLRADGTRMVDAATRKPVVLKGCNLGNWLMIEPWMLGGCLESRDQVQIVATLQQRFGEDRGDRLIDLYRDGYITPRDFELIKSFGFNVVRVPFDYRTLREDAPPYAIKPDAFRWLDKALEMAEAAGIYVILDLHGTPGGNSNQMHTGQADQPGMWGNETYYQRTADVWRALAKRYRDRSVIAAYDLVNEPYGDYQQDVRPELAKLMPMLYRAVRENDDRHLVYFPGALNGGIAFYGDPEAHGFHGVGFTEHFYAGLFGDKTAVESHARDLNQVFPRKQAYAAKLGAPYLVGEFNVVLRAAGGERMMREYYDRMAAYGWTATMWSYKLLKTDGGAKRDAWYAVTNAQTLPKLDLQSSAYEEFERFFRDLGTMDLAVNEPLRKALVEPDPQPIALTKFPELPMTAPDGEPPTGWSAEDVGGASRGGVESGDAGKTLTVYAAGSDIFGTRDAFRFVSRPASGSSETTAQVLSLANSHAYAKAGVMARWGKEADAPLAMVNAFPDGTLALLGRDTRGAVATEKKVQAGTLPVELQLEVRGGQATGRYRHTGSAWILIGTVDTPKDPNYLVGLAVTSHDDAVLTVARFRLGEGAAAQSALPPASASLLQNGSFDHPRRPGAAAPDSWNVWGQWQHERGTVRTSLAEYSGVWQEVDVNPGKRYTFGVRAVPSGANPDDSLELRLEGTLGEDQVTINSNTFRIGRLPVDKDAPPLTVRGTAIGRKLRVLVIATPSPQGAQPAPTFTIHDATLHGE